MSLFNATGGETAVRDDTLRNWRRMSGKLKVVDLKSAYLQIHVDESLWPFQQVCYQGQLYCLTQLGFGLSCAPRLVSRILRKALAQSDQIQQATDHYINGTVVLTEVVPMEKVVAHLECYGLKSMPLEMVEGGHVLGLQLSRAADGTLQFHRDIELPKVAADEAVSKQQLF